MRLACGVARMLPKPRYNGGSPLARNRSSGSGSGAAVRSSHAPVCVIASPGDGAAGPSTASAASHGRFVKMYRGTLSTAPSPSAARCSLTGSRNKLFHDRSLRVHNRRITKPGSNCGRVIGGGCTRDGNVPAQYAA